MQCTTAEVEEVQHRLALFVRISQETVVGSEVSIGVGEDPSAEVSITSKALSAADTADEIWGVATGIVAPETASTTIRIEDRLMQPMRPMYLAQVSGRKTGAL